MGLRHKIGKIRHILREYIFPVPIRLELEQAVFTFTFDDVPVSSTKYGADILEKYGARGTYYVSLGMATPLVNRDAEASDYKCGDRIYFASADEVSELVKRGHDIGCHSYSHKLQSRQPIESVISDHARNRDGLKAITGLAAAHYSYPFGDVSLRTKNVLRNEYATLRSTVGGKNVGRVDLSYLKAVKIYSHELNRAKIVELIESAIASNAWVIFYTHEVCSQPNEWGTTISDFDWLVGELAARHARILSMSQVMEGIIRPTFNK